MQRSNPIQRRAGMAPLEFDLALFDFDGTLADSMPWLARATQRLADEFGFKRMTADEMEQFRDSNPATILSGLGIPLWKMPRIAAAMRNLMAEEADQIRLFDGIEPFLRHATDRGVRLGIVSSNSEANVRVILGPANAELFRHYECGVSLLGKAAKLRRVVKEAGLPVERALYIGDEIRDLEAARKAKMQFGAVSWGFSRVQAFEERKPRVIFRKVSEMGAFLTSA